MESESLTPAFMDCKLFGKTILVANNKFGLVLASPLNKVKAHVSGVLPECISNSCRTP